MIARVLRGDPYCDGETNLRVHGLKVSSFEELPLSAIVAWGVHWALTGRRCANSLRIHDERPLVARGGEERLTEGIREVVL